MMPETRQPDQTHRYAGDVDRHIARRIAERRQVVGITHAQLAERLNTVTYQQLHKYESGKNRVSAGRLWELSKALGVPIQWFYEELS